MPKLLKSKVAGYFLWFDSSCTEEPAHIHTSNSPKLVYAGSAKIWVFINGRTKIEYPGEVSAKALSLICDYLQNHYLEFFRLWSEFKTPFAVLGSPGDEFVLADIEQLQLEQRKLNNLDPLQGDD